MNFHDLIEDLRVFLGADDLFEMANLDQDDTGLKYSVWVSQKGTAPHHARIKVYPEGPSNQGVYFSVSVSDDPVVKRKSKGLKINKIPQRNINKVFEFVKLNKEPLLQYWTDQSMSTKKLLDMLKSV